MLIITKSSTSKQVHLFFTHLIVLILISLLLLVAPQSSRKEENNNNNFFCNAEFIIPTTSLSKVTLTDSMFQIRTDGDRHAVIENANIPYLLIKGFDDIAATTGGSITIRDSKIWVTKFDLRKLIFDNFDITFVNCKLRSVNYYVSQSFYSSSSSYSYFQNFSSLNFISCVVSPSVGFGFAVPAGVLIEADDTQTVGMNLRDLGFYNNSYLRLYDNIYDLRVPSDKKVNLPVVFRGFQIMLSEMINSSCIISGNKLYLTDTVEWRRELNLASDSKQVQNVMIYSFYLSISGFFDSRLFIENNVVDASQWKTTTTSADNVHLGGGYRLSLSLAGNRRVNASSSLSTQLFGVAPDFFLHPSAISSYSSAIKSSSYFSLLKTMDNKVITTMLPCIIIERNDMFGYYRTEIIDFFNGFHFNVKITDNIDTLMTTNYFVGRFSVSHNTVSLKIYTTRELFPGETIQKYRDKYFPFAGAQGIKVHLEDFSGFSSDVSADFGGASIDVCHNSISFIHLNRTKYSTFRYLNATNKVTGISLDTNGALIRLSFVNVSHNLIVTDGGGAAEINGMEILICSFTSCYLSNIRELLYNYNILRSIGENFCYRRVNSIAFTSFGNSLPNSGKVSFIEFFSLSHSIIEMIPFPSSPSSSSSSSVELISDCIFHEWFYGFSITSEWSIKSLPHNFFYRVKNIIATNLTVISEENAAEMRGIWFYVTSSYDIGQFTLNNSNIHLVGANFKTAVLDADQNAVGVGISYTGVGVESINFVNNNVSLIFGKNHRQFSYGVVRAFSMTNREDICRNLKRMNIINNTLAVINATQMEPTVRIDGILISPQGGSFQNCEKILISKNSVVVIIPRSYYYTTTLIGVFPQNSSLVQEIEISNNYLYGRVSNEVVINGIYCAPFPTLTSIQRERNFPSDSSAVFVNPKIITVSPLNKTYFGVASVVIKRNIVVLELGNGEMKFLTFQGGTMYDGKNVGNGMNVIISENEFFGKFLKEGRKRNILCPIDFSKYYSSNEMTAEANFDGISYSFLITLIQKALVNDLRFSTCEISQNQLSMLNSIPSVVVEKYFSPRKNERKFPRIVYDEVVSSYERKKYDEEAASFQLEGLVRVGASDTTVFESIRLNNFSYFVDTNLIESNLEFFASSLQPQTTTIGGVVVPADTETILDASCQKVTTVETSSSSQQNNLVKKNRNILQVTDITSSSASLPATQFVKVVCPKKLFATESITLSLDVTKDTKLDTISKTITQTQSRSIHTFEKFEPLQMSSSVKSVAAIFGAVASIPAAQQAFMISSVSTMRLCSNASIEQFPVDFDTNPLFLKLGSDNIISPFVGSSIGNLILVAIVVIIIVMLMFVIIHRKENVSLEKAQHTLRIPGSFFPVLIVVGMPTSLVFGAVVTYPKKSDFDVLIMIPAMMLFVLLPILTGYFVTRQVSENEELVDVEENERKEQERREKERKRAKKKKKQEEKERREREREQRRGNRSSSSYTREEQENEEENEEQQQQTSKHLLLPGSSIFGANENCYYLRKFWHVLNKQKKEWKLSDYVQTRGIIFDGFSKSWFFLFDYFLALTMGICAGISLNCASNKCCQATTSIALTFALIHLGIIAYLKPFLNLLDSIANISMSVAVAVTAILVLIELLMRQNSDTGATEVDTNLEISNLLDIAASLTFVLVFLVIFVSLLPILEPAVAFLLEWIVEQFGGRSKKKNKENNNDNNEMNDDEGQLLPSKPRSQSRKFELNRSELFNDVEMEKRNHHRSSPQNNNVDRQNQSYSNQNNRRSSSTRMKESYSRAVQLSELLLSHADEKNSNNNSNRNLLSRSSSVSSFSPRNSSPSPRKTSSPSSNHQQRYFHEQQQNLRNSTPRRTSSSSFQHQRQQQQQTKTKTKTMEEIHQKNKQRFELL